QRKVETDRRGKDERWPRQGWITCHQGANLKKFMEYVQQRNIEKVSKFLEKECPLTMASQLEGCAELIKTLLDLGASPDYKDNRGLSPLYHSSMVGGDPYCCELLLHDHAQACRHGHVQHLEHLLFYGADMTAQNASGNTALHVCALYNQCLEIQEATAGQIDHSDRASEWGLAG
ncbi:unnamed protein product, partial [Coregonus sp. 'balchen']